MFWLDSMLYLALFSSQVWDLFTNADQVRDMITNKIQEETLRTYLFTYSSIYTSMSMETLAEMFELPRSTVHSIISKMIINEELMVSYDSGYKLLSTWHKWANNARLLLKIASLGIFVWKLLLFSPVATWLPWTYPSMFSIGQIASPGQINGCLVVDMLLMYKTWWYSQC